MSAVNIIPVTRQMRAEALWRDYQRRPRLFRLTPGHLRYIQRLGAVPERGRSSPSGTGTARPAT